MSPAAAMPVFVNGEAFETSAGSSVSDILSELGIAGDRVAVELNKLLVRKRDWATTILSPNAHLEVVEFVGGG